VQYFSSSSRRHDDGPHLSSIKGFSTELSETDFSKNFTHEIITFTFSHEIFDEYIAA
jgi:hypothetical protein